MAAPESFKAWARDYREAALVRLQASGHGGSGGTARWWANLEDGLRCFLLSRIDPDDWERYMACQWWALPDAVREAIGVEARAMRNQLAGCAWR